MLRQYQLTSLSDMNTEEATGLRVGWDDPIPSRPMGRFFRKSCPMAWDGTETFENHPIPLDKFFFEYPIPWEKSFCENSRLIEERIILLMQISLLVIRVK